MKTTLRLFCMLMALIAMPAFAGQDFACADFLAQQQLKPQHLAFQHCQIDAEAQDAPRIAMYRVPGTQAASVESFFMRRLHMKTLRRACCIWEAPIVEFRDKQGHIYELTMSTEESLITERSAWGGIPYFFVTVKGYSPD